MIEMSDTGCGRRFLLLGLPLGYLAVAAALSTGLRRQRAIVSAWSPDQFESAVAAAGGSAAVRKGLWLDGGFIVLFVGVATPLLGRTGGWWVLPVVAGGLDALEGCLLAAMLKRKPDRRQTRILAVVARTKFTAYLATGAAVIWNSSSSFGRRDRT